MRINNPWAGPQPSPPPVLTTQASIHAAASPNASRVSEAECWLNSTANQIDPFAGVPGTKVARSRSVANGAPEHAAGVTPNNVVIATVHHPGVVPQQLVNHVAAGNPPLQSPNHSAHHTFPTSFSQDAHHHTSRPVAASHHVDPFDSAWAAKAPLVNNPFEPPGDKVTPAFQVQL